MTEQLPTPVDINKLCMHLATHHEYQNRLLVDAGMNPVQIFLEYYAMYTEKIAFFHETNCQTHAPDEPCVGVALAQECVQMLHEQSHGIRHENQEIEIRYINSKKALQTVVDVTNAHHTHTSALPDTVDELLGNL